MKALLSKTPGGPETLVVDELPAPRPGPTQVVVGVQAVGINYPDVLIIQDLYQARPPRPFAPGAELAGTVLAVGSEPPSRWQWTRRCA
jgi:NADPH:quinone reductase-like Zn-dependent oxidoreductase